MTNGALSNFIKRFADTILGPNLKERFKDLMYLNYQNLI